VPRKFTAFWDPTARRKPSLLFPRRTSSVPLNVLLTNIQGYRASGLTEMRHALINAGMRVTTVAPLGNCLLSPATNPEQPPRSLKRVSREPKHPIFDLDGSPVQCVQVAIGMKLVRNLSVVVVGIDETATLAGAPRSATLQAAIESAQLGYPSLAISRSPDTDRSRSSDVRSHAFPSHNRLVAELVAWLSVCPPPVCSVIRVGLPLTLSVRSFKLVASPSAVAERDAMTHGHIAFAPLDLDPQNSDAPHLLCDWAHKSIAAISSRLGMSAPGCAGGCCA
jgi:5'/3'-nucleotidase SurE